MHWKRIEPGWRYTLAQFVLRLLFNRPYHFISPWTMYAIGTGLVILSPDKRRVLLQLRGGPVENAGKYGVFGGFMSPSTLEQPRQCLAREVMEETTLTFNPNLLPENPDYTLVVYNQSKHEMASHHCIGLFWFTCMNPLDSERMQPTEEMEDYRWFTEAEIDSLWEEGRINGDKEDHYGAIKRAFTAARAGKEFPTLKFDF